MRNGVRVGEVDQEVTHYLSHVGESRVRVTMTFRDVVWHNIIETCRWFARTHELPEDVTLERIIELILADAASGMPVGAARDDGPAEINTERVLDAEEAVVRRRATGYRITPSRGLENSWVVYRGADGGMRQHRVTRGEGIGYSCDCGDFAYRKRQCKHIVAVRRFLEGDGIRLDNKA